MNIKRPKVRVQLLQRLALGLRVAGIDKDGGEDVERHKDEVDLRADTRDCNRPDLSDDDGAERGARGGDTETFGTAVGGEDLGCIDPSARSEAHAVCCGTLVSNV